MSTAVSDSALHGPAQSLDGLKLNGRPGLGPGPDFYESGDPEFRVVVGFCHDPAGRRRWQLSAKLNLSRAILRASDSTQAILVCVQRGRYLRPRPMLNRSRAQPEAATRKRPVSYSGIGGGRLPLRATGRDIANLESRFHSAQHMTSMRRLARSRDCRRLFAVETARGATLPRSRRIFRRGGFREAAVATRVAPQPRHSSGTAVAYCSCSAPALARRPPPSPSPPSGALCCPTHPTVPDVKRQIRVADRNRCWAAASWRHFRALAKPLPKD